MLFQTSLPNSRLAWESEEWIAHEDGDILYKNNGSRNGDCDKFLILKLNLMTIFTGYMVQWQWGLSMMRKVKLSCFQESMAGFQIGTPSEMSVLWVRKEGRKDVI